MNKRVTKFTRDYLMHPAGSVLVETGKTKVICTVTLQEGVPPFLKDSGQGWLTAEYGMLPASSNSRIKREATSGKISGRTAEIQRLIGRSLRAVVDLKKFPNYTVMIDCDVIQADGGTRTASITGTFVALYDAFSKMIDKGQIKENPLREFVAAISVGIVDGNIVVDLDYENDSAADTDMNIVMTESGRFIEIQGTAEGEPFTMQQLTDMIYAAGESIKELINEQKRALGLL